MTMLTQTTRNAAILHDLTVAQDPIQAELARLRAENAALREAKANGRAISMKVTEKGGLSVYGLGRFPVTLYRGQWERLLAQAPAILEFIQANAGKLSIKE
jgi:hypothetical protein